MKPNTSKYSAGQGLATTLQADRGDLAWIDNRWYVTHAGLLRIAHVSRCASIECEIVAEVSNPPHASWVVKATVLRRGSSKPFVGFGDAAPSNVSDLVRGAELRVAETRAVNRALRKAYGIGLCSVEEIGTAAPGSVDDSRSASKSRAAGTLCDQLRLTIRQFRLDAAW